MALASAPAIAKRRCPHSVHNTSSPPTWQQRYKLCLEVPTTLGRIRSYSSVFLLLITCLLLFPLPSLHEYRQLQTHATLIALPRAPTELDLAVIRCVWDPGIAALAKHKPRAAITDIKIKGRPFTVSVGVTSRVAVAVESIKSVTVKSIKSTPQAFAWTVESLNCVRILLCTRATFQSAKSAPSNQTSSTNCYRVVDLCGRRLNVQTALQLVTFKTKSPTVDSNWCKGIQSMSLIKHKHKYKYIGLSTNIVDSVAEPSQVAFGLYRATLQILCCQAVESSTVELLYLIPSILSLITGLDKCRAFSLIVDAFASAFESVPVRTVEPLKNTSSCCRVSLTAEPISIAKSSTVRSVYLIPSIQISSSTRVQQQQYKCCRVVKSLISLVFAKTVECQEPSLVTVKFTAKSSTKTLKPSTSIEEPNTGSILASLTLKPHQYQCATLIAVKSFDLTAAEAVKSLHSISAPNHFGSQITASGHQPISEAISKTSTDRLVESQASYLSKKPGFQYTFKSITLAVTDLTATVATPTLSGAIEVGYPILVAKHKYNSALIPTASVAAATVKSVKSVIVPAFPKTTSNCCRVVESLIPTAIVSTATVARPTLVVKSLNYISVSMPPRHQPQRAAQQTPRPPTAPSYAAATAASSLAAAAAAVTNPTPAEAALPEGGTTGPAIGGNTGARPPTALSSSDPKTNITTEGNTNIADLSISDDMDTRAAASAKRSAESPSRVIDEVAFKKTKDSAATAMDTVPEEADWDIFAPPEDPMWPDETKKL